MGFGFFQTQMQFDYFEDVQKDLKKLRHYFPKGSEKVMKFSNWSMWQRKTE